MGRNDLEEIQKALKEFILNSTKKEAPSFAVQTLPDVIGKYLEIECKLRLGNYALVHLTNEPLKRETIIPHSENSVSNRFERHIIWATQNQFLFILMLSLGLLTGATITFYLLKKCFF